MNPRNEVRTALPTPGRALLMRAHAALMLLTQGVMSAVSAGMLISAATVEMLAADFVFGDVTGGHSHHSGGHGHAVADVEGGGGGGAETPLSALPPEDEPKGSTVGQKVVAVGSLLTGVLAMNLTAVFE